VAYSENFPENAFYFSESATVAIYEPFWQFRMVPPWQILKILAKLLLLGLFFRIMPPWQILNASLNYRKH